MKDARAFSDRPTLNALPQERATLDHRLWYWRFSQLILDTFYLENDDSRMIQENRK